MTKILVISDTQAPAHHPNTIEFLKKEAKLFNPDRVIHIGDELDLHGLSKYAKNPDLPGPKDEIEQGLEFMHQLYDIFPEVDVCISNHGSRPYIRAYEAGIPSKFIKSYKEWMEAPKGWNWHQQIVIDNIAFIHGEELSGDAARLKACTLMQKSCVFGHIHSHAGVSYFSTRESLLFGFNVGCLIDLHSPYFAYNKHQLHRPIIGIGLIDNGLPMFKPMQLDQFGLWVDRKDKSVVRPLPEIDEVMCPKCQSHRIRFYGKDTRRGRSVQLIFCNNCRKKSSLS